MNLPFLKKNNISQAIMTTKVRPSDTPEDPEDQQNQGLLSAARDLITAVQSGDEKAVASALEAAYQILDSQAPEEGANESEETPNEI